MDIHYRLRSGVHFYQLVGVDRKWHTLGGYF